MTTALLAAVVVALTANLFLARYSSRGFETLTAHKMRIEANLAELEALHEDLQGQVELLTRNSDMVRVQARALGYYGDDETVVRFQDIESRQRSQSPGRIILATPEHRDRRSVVRIAAAAAGLAVFLILVLTGSSHRLNDR